MATYNGALFIEEQIRSILDQLTVDDELIISDDGSTDKTVQLINFFGDQRIRLVYSQGHKSPAQNFENALQHAQGAFIFLSDQDDIWYPDKVQTVLNSLINYDLVVTDCQIVDKDGKILHDSFFESRRSRRGFWRNLWKNSYMGCCMAFKREVLAYALPFPPQLYFHDWWIGLMVERQGTPYFLTQALIKYRRHGYNVTPTGETPQSYQWRVRFRNRFWLSWSVMKRSIALSQ
ncbi:glycosyltransferase family 2 protein [Spirosoma oryzicola]|uniref:glycosyltransferase family 2 protein n=1 Tax=Spirosoma oryzicola TaxID=2898794 RepID=UPI001E299562|nr:glycosyltransferase family 2 protein [Spirosoma oryzicola]UHG92167.1 glycosyltransferase family 2 protein [Spirosoma oryzicola]